VPFFEREGWRIHHEDSGGGGAALVLSHGIMMDLDMFAPQVRGLSPEFRCIAWDARGHGRTEGRGAFTYWDSAQDLIALLDHLEVERAFLCGMSQGGFVSLRAALLAPERVQGLMFIDSQAGAEAPHLVSAYDGLLAAWREGPTEALAETVANVILGPADHTPWAEKWLARPSGWMDEPYATLVGREDLHDRLHEITCPALVIHGEDDAAITMDQAEALCRGLAGCEGLVRIPEAGHAANLSHPGVVTEALRDFLRHHAG
jgi:3-oxoadipate enol-lactonase